MNNSIKFNSYHDTGAAMDISITPSILPLPIPRAFVVSMTIKSFKGRREVDVHLFRPSWDPAEEASYDFSKLIDDSQGSENGHASSRKVIMEAFTEEERDTLVKYLAEHYESRLCNIYSAPMDFPVPAGLPPLGSLTPGKDVGFIYFHKIPHFDLPFPVQGLYDLSVHKPIIGPEK